MAYLGKTPSQAVRSRYYFTASGSETSLSPTEVTGLSFTDANYVDVSLNGVALVSGTDYTATPSTNTISGLAALAASDVVEIVVYDTFSVFGGKVLGDFDISNGTLSAEAVTVTGLTTTGNINFGDDDKAIFGAASDLQVYHDGSNSYVRDAGDGNLRLTSNSEIHLAKHNNEFMVKASADGDVQLYYDSAAKLATTSSGIDVTGTVTADGLTVDTDTLHVDATNNRVGVGTTSPDTPLNVESAASATKIKYAGTSNAHFGLQIESNISGGNFESDFANGTTAMLDLFANSTSTSGGDFLVARTQASDPVLLVKGNGNVGIGTDSPNTTLEVFGAGSTTMRLHRDNASGGGGIDFYNNTQQVANINAGSGTLTLKADPTNAAASSIISFETDGSEVGRWLAGGGLTFNGDTAAANALDDYEQGTWTPTGATNSGTAATFGSAEGSYVKIGNLVTVNGKVTDVDTTGTTSSSQFRIAGLPFAPVSINWTGSASTNSVVFQSSRTMVTCQLNFSTDVIYFNVTADGNSRTVVDHNHITSGTSDFFFTVQYQTFS